MPGLHPIIARILAFMAFATLIAMALGLGSAGSADDTKTTRVQSSSVDPLWPEHLRCLILGTAAIDDVLCRAIMTAERRAIAQRCPTVRPDFQFCLPHQLEADGGR